MAKCRICLRNKPRKDISELIITQNGEIQTYKHVMMFCLGIQITDDPISNTKLCVKCFKKIIDFYYFKVLAIRNDEAMRDILTSEVENNVYCTENEIKEEIDWDGCEMSAVEESLESTKDEAFHDGVDDIDVIKLKLEDESDDDLLSVVKHLKENNREEIGVKKIGSNRKRVKLKEVILTPEELKERKARLKGRIAAICEKCGKMVKDIRQHKRLHMPAEKQTQYKCEHCDKVFKNNIYRRRHVQRAHLSCKQECGVCGKSVIDLKLHTQTMHMKDSMKFECVHCQLRFPTRARLNAHITVHTKDRPFECEQCGACFRLKLTLNNHRRQVHDKEKSHACPLCPKKYFKKDHLKIHVRSHTNEKPYECLECGKRLATATILKSHRLRHGNVKNYKCDMCDASFFTHNNLYNHKMSHLKQKRYPCRYCGAKFHRSDHRNRHERTGHIKHGHQLRADEVNDLTQPVPASPSHL